MLQRKIASITHFLVNRWIDVSTVNSRFNELSRGLVKLVILGVISGFFVWRGYKIGSQNRVLVNRGLAKSGVHCTPSALTKPVLLNPVLLNSVLLNTVLLKSLPHWKPCFNLVLLKLGFIFAETIKWGMGYPYNVILQIPLWKHSIELLNTIHVIPQIKQNKTRFKPKQNYLGR